MYSNISVDVEGLDALLWTLTAVAIVLSIGRFAIRYATANRFHWDDASHLLSILLLIGLAAAYTVGYPLSARIARISMKKEKAPPLTDPFYHKYLQLRLVVTLLVFMVLWSVKATFLIFYRLLFSVNQTFLRLWWGAVALTFASFWVCIGSTFTLCGAASDLYNFKKCSSPQSLHNIRATYKYWCALNVGSDLIVIILPLFMLHGLQLPALQKTTLAMVFCLALIVAVFDILRTVESLTNGTFSGVALWSSLEVTVAVIVASLPLYRAFLSQKGRDSLVSRLSLLGAGSTLAAHDRSDKSDSTRSDSEQTEFKKSIDVSRAASGSARGGQQCRPVSGLSTVLAGLGAGGAGRHGPGTFRNDLETNGGEEEDDLGPGFAPVFHAK